MRNAGWGWCLNRFHTFPTGRQFLEMAGFTEQDGTAPQPRLGARCDDQRSRRGGRFSTLPMVYTCGTEMEPEEGSFRP